MDLWSPSAGILFSSTKDISHWDASLAIRLESAIVHHLLRYTLPSDGSIKRYSDERPLIRTMTDEFESLLLRLTVSKSQTSSSFHVLPGWPGTSFKSLQVKRRRLHWSTARLSAAEYRYSPVWTFLIWNFILPNVTKLTELNQYVLFTILIRNY